MARLFHSAYPSDFKTNVRQKECSNSIRESFELLTVHLQCFEQRINIVQQLSPQAGGAVRTFFFLKSSLGLEVRNILIVGFVKVIPLCVLLYFDEKERPWRESGEVVMNASFPEW